MPRKERSRLTLSSHVIARYYERGGMRKPSRAAIEKQLFGLLRDGVSLDGDLAVLVPYEDFVWVAVPNQWGGWVAVTVLRADDMDDVRRYLQRLRRERMQVESILNETKDVELIDTMVLRLTAIEDEQSRVLRQVKQEVSA